MKITEIEWIKEHRDELAEPEIRALNRYNFFEQLEEGELSLPLPKTLELMQLAREIYFLHNIDRIESFE